MKQVITVLGMHRSGTSALMRGLHALGVETGDDLLPPAEDNTKGFWEDREIFEFNEHLLRALDSSWDCELPIDFDAPEPQAVAELKTQAAELLQRKLASHPVFGIKDPRLCKVLPFWQEVFSTLPVTDKYVICIRNPLAVAASLERRNGFGLAKSLRLWLVHSLPLLLRTCNKPVVVVEYERLLADPARELERVAAALDLTVEPEALAEFCSAYLDRKLDHFQAPARSLEQVAAPIMPLHDVYLALQELARDAVSAQDPALHDRFRRFEGLFWEQVGLLALKDRFERRSGALEQENRELRTRLAYVESEAEAHRAFIVEQSAAITRLDADLQQLTADLALERHESAARQLRIQGLTTELTYANEHIQLLKSSFSWRVTAPVRFASRLLRDPRSELRHPGRLIKGGLRWLLHLTPLPRRVKEPLAILGHRCLNGAQTLLLAVRQKGGLRKAAGSGLAILRHEGPGGILRRVRGLCVAEPPQLAATVEPRAPIDQTLRPRDAGVDVIVCVHNALEDVRRCLDSVFRHTAPPFRLIVVDDGSGPETRDFLQEYLQTRPGLLLRNEQALGYTHAANMGMRAAEAPYLVLLNSDTIVSEQWLERLVQCMESDPAVGIVGPLSNTASWQSVPELLSESGTDWSDNPLPPDLSVADMAAAVAEVSLRQYPKVGILNGFCMLIRKRALDEVGLFDEERFAGGYGEENDFCLRTTAAGWRMAVADDCYVYHAQSKSYSNERRKLLYERSAAALEAKHGRAAIQDALDRTVEHPVLQSTRARIATVFERCRLLRENAQRFHGKKVLFLLFISVPGGGGNIIIREAQAMLRYGARVTLANLRANQETFEALNPHAGLAVVYVDKPEDIADLAPDYDAVVASLFTTVDQLALIQERQPDNAPVLGYYVQDYEPSFFSTTDPMHVQAFKSYTKVPGLRLVTKTAWNRREVHLNTNATATEVGPSFNWDLFYATRDKRRAGALVVTAMVRFASPHRSPQLTMEVLQRLKERYGSAITVVVFGTDEREINLHCPTARFEYRAYGALSPAQVATLLDQSHIFLDFSTYQAMGLTAMEAMACGAAVVGPLNGGLGEIVRDGVDGLLVDTSDAEACFVAACRLVDDQALRLALQKAAVRRVTRHYPERAALRILESLFA